MRGVAVLRSVAICCLLVVAAASRAEARDGIVVESYTSERPRDAATTLGPLLGELAARGFLTGEGVGRIYESKVSREGGPSLPADFAEKLKAGQKAYISGKFDEAMEQLGPLIDAAHVSSGAFARNQPLRKQLVDALIALSLAQQRSGDPSGARVTMGDLVRSFPETSVARATWGPEAAQLFEQVKREIRDQSRGRVVVKLTDESAEVFINERFEQRGTTVKELPPGEYRVVVQQGAMQSRNHRVSVLAGVDTTVSIDLSFDAVVHTAPWTGFVYGTSADREKLEVTHALALASAINERAVIVIGIDQVKGRSAIVGAAITAGTGRETRRASLALDPPPSADRLAALGRFLAGDPAGPGIEVQLDGEAPGMTPLVGRPVDRSPSPRWNGWTWIVGGLAVGGIATGIGLLLYDGHCPDGSDNPNCPDVYSTRTPALITLGGGAVLAGLTLYLIASRPSTSTSTAYVTPTSGGALAGVSLRF